VDKLRAALDVARARDARLASVRAEVEALAPPEVVSEPQPHVGGNDWTWHTADGTCHAYGRSLSWYQVHGDYYTRPESAWEKHDVDLGEKAEHLVSQLAEVVRTFTEREKDEGGASKGAKRILRAAKHLSTNPSLLKEFPPMSDTNELVKALDELESARRDTEKAEKKAQKKADAKKAAKRDEKKAAKAAKKVAKAGGEPEKDAPKLTKALGKIQKQVDAIAAQDAKRVTVNGAGVAAILRGGTPENALKSFDDRVNEASDRVAKASNEFEKMRSEEELRTAQKQRAAAKLVAMDNARSRGDAPRGRFGPNSAELLTNVSTLPADRAVGAI
jgi:hypothetical protein